MLLAVGEDECNAYLQKKAVGKTFKTVHQVMMASLVNGYDTLPIRISKPMVRAVAIMALQPMVGGSRIDNLNYEVLVHHYNLVEVFLEFLGSCLAMLWSSWSLSHWCIGWFLPAEVPSHLSPEAGLGLGKRNPWSEQEGDLIRGRLGSGKP